MSKPWYVLQADEDTPVVQALKEAARDAIVDRQQMGRDWVPYHQYNVPAFVITRRQWDALRRTIPPGEIWTDAPSATFYGVPLFVAPDGWPCVESLVDLRAAGAES